MGSGTECGHCQSCVIRQLNECTRVVTMLTNTYGGLWPFLIIPQNGTDTLSPHCHMPHRKVQFWTVSKRISEVPKRLHYRMVSISQAISKALLMTGRVQNSEIQRNSRVSSFYCQFSSLKSYIAGGTHLSREPIETSQKVLRYMKQMRRTEFALYVFPGQAWICRPLPSDNWQASI